VSSPADPAADHDGATKRTARVSFETVVHLTAEPAVVWERLTDWARHGEWIPLTRVEVDPSDPDRFVAYSGVGPLTLEDRMVVEEMHFDGAEGICRVAKLGPVLTGHASFHVSSTAGGTTVRWVEDVTVPRLPRPLAPAAAAVARLAFERSLRRLPS
jgi:hypothetical protein